MKFERAVVEVFCLVQIFCVTMCVILGDKTQQTTVDQHCKLSFAKYVSLNCSHQNLTFIPEIGGRVDNIIFGYNILLNVSLQTFNNISFPEHIIGLSLEYDNIRSISSDSLEKFARLNRLDLSGNPINYDDLRSLLGETTKLQNLSLLKLNYMKHIAIQKDTFSLMTGTTVLFMNLIGDNVISVSLKMFNVFTNLQTLVFSNNLIKNLVLWKLPYLNSLNLQHNQLYEIPNFCSNENLTDPYFPELARLDVSDNGIKSLTQKDLKCLLNLEQLHISSNLIARLPNDILRNVPKLQYLNAKYQDVYHFRIEPFALRSKSLSNLELGYHGQAQNVFVSPEKTFKFTPNLKLLVIFKLQFTRMKNDDIKKMFLPLTKLVRFQCYKCGIQQDLKYFLAEKNDLTTLDLSDNFIQTLGNGTFKWSSRLDKLRISRNKIGHFSKLDLPEKMLDRLKVFDISLNPFICDCELEWFIQWVGSKKHKENVLFYPEEYRCASPVSLSGRQLANVHFSYRYCNPWSPWIWVAIVTGPFLVLATAITVIVYRNRWNLKHYIYLLRKRKNYQRLAGNNYVYDAFVSYETDDSMWVRRQLIPVLEDRENMKLCIHERDFLPGVFINDNIVTKIDSSHKIIIVLTNAFAKSGWCIFELKVAHSKLIEDQTEVIVILLEKIDAGNMNHSLKVLLETTTYIEWTEDRVGQELFWTKLKNALNH